MRCLADWGSLGSTPTCLKQPWALSLMGHIVGPYYLLWGMATEDLVLS